MARLKQANLIHLSEPMKTVGYVEFIALLRELGRGVGANTAHREHGI
jgi:hypothetical protein